MRKVLLLLLAAHVTTRLLFAEGELTRRGFLTSCALIALGTNGEKSQASSLGMEEFGRRVAADLRREGAAADTDLLPMLRRIMWDDIQEIARRGETTFEFTREYTLGLSTGRSYVARPHFKITAGGRFHDRERGNEIRITRIEFLSQ